ncbi:hypothetical protein [Vibrio sp. CAU 1672]|uniref:hypothetical protein n=1 Tax=Vibrio sp. CAU 1672 TaxID=3032594 RepID=UPI0023DB45F8|nr:hypothetical protein [Vibrio sp. CAU 1672]MDF2152700.1 hypothetical protein [Vibrio sp. CAU 1672]
MPDKNDAQPFIDQAIELLSDMEHMLQFDPLRCGDYNYLHDLVMWMKTGIPEPRFAPTKDGLNLLEVAQSVLRSTYIPDEKLLQYATERCGFSEEGTGVRYPTQATPSTGTNPDEMTNVLISYWVGGFSEVLMPESIYLLALKEYLCEQQRTDLVKTLLTIHQFDPKTASQNEQLHALSSYLPDLHSALLVMPDTDNKHLTERLIRLGKALAQIPLTPARRFGHLRTFHLW